MNEDERKQLREQIEFEQNSARLADMMAGFWHELFMKLTARGFTEEQALSLIKARIYGEARARS